MIGPHELKGLGCPGKHRPPGQNPPPPPNRLIASGNPPYWSRRRASRSNRRLTANIGHLEAHRHLAFGHGLVHLCEQVGPASRCALPGCLWGAATTAIGAADNVVTQFAGRWACRAALSSRSSEAHGQKLRTSSPILHAKGRVRDHGTPHAPPQTGWPRAMALVPVKGI